VDKNHNIIKSKTIAASAKEDEQTTMKVLFKNACITERMAVETSVVCLADGSDNCKSIAYSIEKYCKNITYILDWFHISMKLQNIAIPESISELFRYIKWNLWHGYCDKALEHLDKLSKLSTYISNNQMRIVNYDHRKNRGLVFISNLSESTVNTLINEGQKGKQKMLWGKEGAHNVLQIRSTLLNESWENNWKSVEDKIYKVAV